MRIFVKHFCLNWSMSLDSNSIEVLRRISNVANFMSFLTNYINNWISSHLVIIHFRCKSISSTTWCPKKNWSLGFLPYRFFPIHCEHFRGHLNIVWGSYTKIKSCQVIFKLFHIKNALLNSKKDQFFLGHIVLENSCK